MIIDLPRRFRCIKNRKSDYAKVKRGELHIYGTISFRRIIYDITYALKGKRRCYYCGKKMRKKEITLDHMFSQATGGPTIPNNLVPCCIYCNEEKGNLSTEQYQILLSLDEKQRKGYRKLISMQQNSGDENKQYNMPEEWITFANVDQLIVHIRDNRQYKKEKYSYIKLYYEQYHHLKRPIITDKNGFVLDGYAVLMFAREAGIKKVPTIVLENVVYESVI